MTLDRAQKAATAGAGAALSAGAVVGTAVTLAANAGAGLAAGVVVAATSLSATLAAVRLKVTDPER